MRVEEHLCVRCRGGRGLCGLTYCPVIVSSVVRDLSLRIGSEVYGSSPPSVFVGRYGYPYVRVGPATPPELGDTYVYDTPEFWLRYSLNDVLSFRYSLIRGTYITTIDNVNDRYVCNLQELVLTLKPVDIEMRFEKPPKPKVLLDEYLPPQGPSAPLRNLRICSNPVSDKRVEKVFYDTDLRAFEGVVRLYRDGVPVSAIQRLLSVGGLGSKNFRRLVPTRWSITAVDAIISQHLRNQIRNYPPVNNYLLFIRSFMDNLFIGILAPRTWSFEWMEAWFPGSTWNRFGGDVEVEGDYEGFRGRSEYPDIGGCYYAARLASTEALLRMKRQATVILWREIYEGFNIPIGVWFVRENLRAMFNDKPKSFTSINEVLNYLRVNKITRVPLDVWVRKSKLMNVLLRQEVLDRFKR